MTPGILEILRLRGAATPLPLANVTWEDAVEPENMIADPFELRLIRIRIQLLDPSTAAKMAGMKPTIIEALKACDGVTLDAAIKRLVKECGEDRNVCRDVVSDLWREGLIKITSGKGSAQARVELTDAGMHKVMTQKTGQTARDILSEIENLP